MFSDYKNIHSAAEYYRNAKKKTFSYSTFSETHRPAPYLAFHCIPQKKLNFTAH
jgi:hypothetical protein